MRHRREILVLLLLLPLSSCKTGAIDPGNLDGHHKSDAHVTWLEQGVISYDLGPPSDGGGRDLPPGVDLTTKPGDPCTYGKCIDTLICMANMCHSICSTECGDTAPECTTTEGCHWVTSFSAACMPGTAKWPETCGGGTWCIGGYLCVSMTGKGSKCLRLCKYGCPSGTICGSTTGGCKICIPYP